MLPSVRPALSHWCILRVYAETAGPVAALILVTHTRRGTDVHEFELPYLLWESLGTRAAARLVTHHYRRRHADAVAHLGLRTVQRRIAACLTQHDHERLAGPAG